jgi:hypothetical protein
MTTPPPVAPEICVLCGASLCTGAERCPECDLWIGVDGPGVRRPLPRLPLLAMVAGIAAVWFVTLGLAAVLG